MAYCIVVEEKKFDHFCHSVVAFIFILVSVSTSRYVPVPIID